MGNYLIKEVIGVKKALKHIFFSAMLIASSLAFIACGSGNNSCKHEWKEADCTSPRTCAECGETEGEALGHNWIDASCDKPKTCKNCGATEGEPLEHKWQEADCTHPKTCSVCGATEGKSLGHKFDTNDICTKDAVCERCHETKKAVGHKWKEATCTAPKECSICGTTEGEALGHDFVGGKCKRCGIEVLINVLMYSDSDIDVYYTGLSEGMLNSAQVDFYAENKSNHNITLQVRNESINGSMVSFTCSSTIAPGKNIHDNMSCSYSLYLNKIGVYSASDINTVEFSLHLYDKASNYQSKDTPPITIDTKNCKVTSASLTTENGNNTDNKENNVSIADVENYFKGLCEDLKKNDNEDAQITMYEMKQDYYQIGYFVPKLEWLYNNDPITYNKFITSCQQLSASFKQYLDANGFTDYHAYVSIGADPPSKSDSSFERVLMIEIRDGVIALDATKTLY